VKGPTIAKRERCSRSYAPVRRRARLRQATARSRRSSRNSLRAEAEKNGSSARVLTTASAAVRATVNNRVDNEPAGSSVANQCRRRWDRFRAVLLPSRVAARTVAPPQPHRSRLAVRVGCRGLGVPSSDRSSRILSRRDPCDGRLLRAAVAKECRCRSIRLQLSLITVLTVAPSGSAARFTARRVSGRLWTRATCERRDHDPLNRAGRRSAHRRRLYRQ
jgi:hypothetical protein